MAIDQTGNTGDYFEYTIDGTDFNNSTPLSVAFWVIVRNSGVAKYLWTINETSNGNPLLRVYMSASDDIQFFARYNGTNLSKTSAANALLHDEWAHVCTTWDGGDAHSGVKVYVNGSEVSYGTSFDGAAGNLFTGGNRLCLLHAANTGRGDGFPADGSMAECGIWKRVLSAGEVANLAAGYRPDQFQNSLIFYSPLRAVDDADDVIGGLTPTNTDYTTVRTGPTILTTPVNITPNQATANHATRSRPVFISHEDLGSPAAGDMMRLRVLRDYDHVANTDDLQLHNVALWQKNADTA